MHAGVQLYILARWALICDMEWLFILETFYCD